MIVNGTVSSNILAESLYEYTQCYCNVERASGKVFAWHQYYLK